MSLIFSVCSKTVTSHDPDLSSDLSGRLLAFMCRIHPFTTSSLFCQHVNRIYDEPARICLFKIWITSFQVDATIETIICFFKLIRSRVLHLTLSKMTFRLQQSCSSSCIRIFNLRKMQHLTLVPGDHFCSDLALYE